MSRNPSEDLQNPNLFTDYAPGQYTYEQNEFGKSAYGQLTRIDSIDIQRNHAAQANAGGDARRHDGSEGVDDGGHLIGARYAGATTDENLTAQDRNLNRGSYKATENSWDTHLSNGDKVFVYMDGYDSGNTGRPANYEGYAIFEHEDGSRDIEYYSFNNESRTEQAQWAEAEAQAEAENPEASEAMRAQNTAMPYIWDEDQQDVVENPYYTPDSELDAGANSSTTGAGDNSHSGSSGSAIPAQESGTTASEDFGPSAGDVGTSATASEDFSPSAGDVGASATASEDFGPSAGDDGYSGTDSGRDSSDSGMDDGNDMD